VLGDVAVSHPAPRVRDVEQDVDRLAGTDEDRVLPDEVGLDDVVARLALASGQRLGARLVFQSQA
jgi:hypothetical protein